MAETYLGDGLYASYDGFMFILRAPRSEGDHWVGLEPAVLRAFEEYTRSIKEIKRAQSELGNPQHTDASPDSKTSGE